MPDEQTPDSAPRESAFGVLRHRGVRDLLTANFLLYTAVSLQAAALMKEVYDISGRKADLGWIGLAEFVPSALLVLVTGPLADRMNRKLMALCAISVELVATGALLWYSLTDPTDVKPFFAIAFLYGIGRAFAAPATRTMPPMVAPEGRLPQVIAGQGRRRIAPGNQAPSKQKCLWEVLAHQFIVVQNRDDGATFGVPVANQPHQFGGGDRKSVV